MCVACDFEIKPADRDNCTKVSDADSADADI